MFTRDAASESFAVKDITSVTLQTRIRAHRETKHLFSQQSHKGCGTGGNGPFKAPVKGIDHVAQVRWHYLCKDGVVAGWGSPCLQQAQGDQHVPIQHNCARVPVFWQPLHQQSQRMNSMSQHSTSVRWILFSGTHCRAPQCVFQISSAFVKPWRTLVETLVPKL